jgi:PASTA domain
MTETVKVPGVGKPLPKWAVFGGLGVAGLLIFQYYKNRKSQSATAAAAAAATSTSQYPPDGTVGNPQDLYSTDPATGQTYGDEAAGSGGTFGAFSGGGSSSGIIGYDTNGNPIYAPGYGPGNTSGSGVPGPPFSNNAAWANYAISQLGTANPNLDVGALTDALGLYLAGQPVAAAQKTLIFDAIAVAGDPPVAGPNGYPPKVQTNGGTGGGAPTVVVPNVLHLTRLDAGKKIKAAGLKDDATGAKHGHVVSQSPAGGSKVAPGSAVHITIK